MLDWATSVSSRRRCPLRADRVDAQGHQIHGGEDRLRRLSSRAVRTARRRRRFWFWRRLLAPSLSSRAVRTARRRRRFWFWRRLLGPRLLRLGLVLVELAHDALAGF